jgi:hypothetical protein
MQSEGVNVTHPLPFNTLLYLNMAAVTKREVVDEEKLFQILQTENIALFLLKGMLFVLLVSNENISALKEYTVKRHYETKDSSQVSCIEEQLRRYKISKPQNHLAIAKLIQNSVL